MSRHALRPPHRAHRLHGRGQDDARRASSRRGSAAPFVDLDARSRSAAGDSRSRSSSRARGGGLPAHRGRHALDGRSAGAEPAVIALGGGAVTTPEQSARRCAPRAFTLLRRRRRRHGLGARARLRPAARAGRGRLPRALRGAPAALRGGRRRGRDRRRERRARRRRRPRRDAARSSGSASSSRATARSSSSPTRTSPGIYGMEAQLALGDRLRATHELPPGEEAKTIGAVDRLWRELRLDRGGTLVALGGGCTTDIAGFAAATYMRGIDVGRRADDARRPGRRGDRRQDRDRPPGRQEPRRRLPLAGAHGDRPGAPRDAARGRAANGLRRAREDGPARRRAALGAAARRGRPRLRRVQDRRLPPRPARPRRPRASSTSATRSRTRSRPPPTTSCRTDARSRSACSRRSGSPGCDTDVGRARARGPSRCASTASAPGRRSRATRRPPAAYRSSSCSRRRASRGSASSCRRPTCARRWTL